ncbi:nucleoside-diphosphate kinase [Candidatus Woesearchaeota archaeon]|nr:nucleoside-diphosphate kinase [Candidatus Woesearchaeota archaeon]MBW3021421.1 nucleoside-diphosphate kinase [Candidatus Woesearchaeota archaeon]
MIERSLVLIKPDGVQRGLVGEIIKRFEQCCLKIIGMKMVYADEKLAGEHYADDEEWMKAVGTKQKAAYAKKGVEIKETEIEIGQRVRRMLMDYVTMSPVIALVIEGHNAVAKIRKIVGATSPFDSEPGTIRGDFAIDHYPLADAGKRPIQNLIHASGTPEEAERELKVWFKDDEIYVWKRVDEDLVYRKNL